MDDQGLMFDESLLSKLRVSDKYNEFCIVVDKSLDGDLDGLAEHGYSVISYGVIYDKYIVNITRVD